MKFSDITQRLQSVEHDNNIDVLRACAILSVALHHFAAYSGIPVPLFGPDGGGIGVQLFFLISGYLIIQSAERNSLGDYAKARFFRIFPVYWVALVGIVLVEMALVPGFRQLVVSDYPHFLLNLLNLQQLSVRSSLYFDRVHVGWTLTVELFWYAIVPVLALVAHRLRWRHFWLGVLALSTLLSVVWIKTANTGALDFLYLGQARRLGLEFSPVLQHALIKSNIVGYLYFFVMGTVIYRYEAVLKRIPSSILWPVALLLIVLWSQWQVVVGLAPQPLAAVGLACVFILLLKLPPIKDVLVRYIGKISYSLYLVHAKVMLVVYVNLQWSGAGAHLAVVVAALLLATVLYYTVEQPMIEYGKRFRSTRRVGTAAATAN
ncbi:putative acyltransferase [Acidovorax sp. CF316]|uniref:acyltransferase family protein n=1 Tax=Acidovorax sp. CF316 TaxID=1144317 RepID=UPI00026BC23D|nr:acyltransferase [Acidovorax sp. CF316]EJE54542.1 putative acyltransferase [Acidovorax sp. CF316]